MIDGSLESILTICSTRSKC